MNYYYSLLKQDARFIYEDGLFYQTGFQRNHIFEKNYLQLRKKEDRVYSDAAAALLPEFQGKSNLSTEWKIRKQSARRLIQHLQQKRPSRIIEIGCGNGWLMRYLQQHVPADYLGVDINEFELRQATRIADKEFSSCFLYGNILSESVVSLRADVIIMASAAHYFADLKSLIERLLLFLTPNGEVHIIDTPFYSEGELKEAKRRSEKYFSDMNAWQNGINYYHHTLGALDSLNPVIAYRPNDFINRLKRKVIPDSPFPWVIIKK